MSGEETVTVQQQVRIATRAYRVPECTEYQSVQSNRVYRIPECIEYRSIKNTRMNKV